MNIRDLEYIVAVSRHQHFGKAANFCNVSQPTLSGQIKKLEEQLNVKLFERSNKHIRLTDTGAQIVAIAQRILNEVQTIHTTAKLSQDPLSGKFRLGAFPTLSTYLFPSLVTKITQVLPKLRLILIEEKTDKLLEQLSSGQIDSALLALPLAHDNFQTLALFEDKFKLAVPSTHPLASRHTVAMGDLTNTQLLLLEEGHCLRDQAMEVCQLTGAAEQDFRATGLETLRQMVRAGTGITLMPEIAISKHPDTEIAYIAFRGTAPSRTIGLVWRASSGRLAVIEQLGKLLMA